MTIFNILTMLNVSNPRTLYRFLALNDFYDKKNKELKITKKEFVLEYRKYVKQRFADSYLIGKRGRPKLVKVNLERDFDSRIL